LDKRKQIQEHQKAIKEDFKNSIPDVKIQLKSLTLPLTIIDHSHICRWLLRDQITLKDIPKDILAEFMKSKQYRHFEKVYKFYGSKSED